MIKQAVLPKQVLNVFPKEAIEEIVQLRMRIHQQPELAFEEFKTQEILKTFCEALNPKECTTIAQTGLLVRIAGENSSLPPVAVRGDIDALPIVEDTGLEYQSEKKGVMHACGHDVHAAWAAATVYLLSKKPAKRDVIVIFQPAEEQSKGAKAIMQTGKLAEVAMIFGGHVDRNYAIGEVVVHDGPIAANSDHLTVTINGKSAHAARPHEGNNPILAAADFIKGIPLILTNKINPSENGVVTISAINGGTIHNIIADQIVIQGSIRSMNAETQFNIHQEIKHLADSLEKWHSVQINVTIDKGAVAIINNSDAVRVCQKAVRKICSDSGLIHLKSLNLASEDFGYYAEKIPACFMRIGARYKEDPFIAAHNPKFIAEHETIFVGASVLTESVRLLDE